MTLNWIWFWAFEDWTLSLSRQMFLSVLLISHREYTWHVSCPHTCLLTLKWSVFTPRQVQMCSDYFQCKMSWIWCTNVLHYIHCSPRLMQKCEWALAFLRERGLLIVREMVIGGPLPSVPDMVPSTSQGLFHCCGLHLAPYVIPNSKCKWALCYSRKIDH